MHIKGRIINLALATEIAYNEVRNAILIRMVGGTTAEISGDRVNHILGVLRMKYPDMIMVDPMLAADPVPPKHPMEVLADKLPGFRLNRIGENGPVYSWNGASPYFYKEEAMQAWINMTDEERDAGRGKRFPEA